MHYYHHLVDFYSDVAEDGPQAVHWARQDLALRENFSTQGALAWALHRDGRPGEALEWMDVRWRRVRWKRACSIRRREIYAAAGRSADADNIGSVPRI